MSASSLAQLRIDCGVLLLLYRTCFEHLPPECTSPRAIEAATREAGPLSYIYLVYAAVRIRIRMRLRTRMRTLVEQFH